LQCQRNHEKTLKINLLACPENCNVCSDTNTCGECNPNYPYFDPSQKKCRGCNPLIYVMINLFLDCSKFDHCLSCGGGPDGFECSQCEPSYYWDNDYKNCFGN